jgi:hypothetical protein
MFLVSLLSFASLFGSFYPEFWIPQTGRNPRDWRGEMNEWMNEWMRSQSDHQDLSGTSTDKHRLHDKRQWSLTKNKTGPPSLKFMRRDSILRTSRVSNQPMTNIFFLGVCNYIVLIFKTISLCQCRSFICLVFAKISAEQTNPRKPKRPVARSVVHHRVLRRVWSFQIRYVRQSSRLKSSAFLEPQFTSKTFIAEVFSIDLVAILWCP